MEKFNSNKDIIDYFDGVLVQNVVAISKSFAKVLPKWSQVEVKLFFAMLERLNWRDPDNGNVVVLRNEDLHKRIGWHEHGSGNLRQFSKYILKILDQMKISSNIKVQDINRKTGDKTTISGLLFYHVEGNTEYTVVVFNSKFMRLLENLLKTQNYFTYWISDIYALRSKHAQNLYFELIEKSKNFKGEEQSVDFTTKQLKNIFGLTKESYMDKDGFNRSKFEKRTIDKAIEEILNCKLIELIPFKDGKFYQKIKNGKFVDKYNFKYRIRKEVLDEKNGSYWYDKKAFIEQKRLNEEETVKLVEKGIKIYEDDSAQRVVPQEMCSTKEFFNLEEVVFQ